MRAAYAVLLPVALLSACTNSAPKTKGCAIDDGGSIAEGVVDPQNPCQSCQTAASTSGYSARTDGTACGSGEVCSQGACSPGCFIGGAFLGAGAVNAANICGLCTPALSATQWSSAANGKACGTGQVCTGGSCGPGCFIDGGALPPGQVNPADTCQACDPTSSTTAWSAKVDGTDCGPAEVCAAGACAAGCFINGAVRSPSSANPQDACQVCTPDAGTQAWTALADGISCGLGQVCNGGACVLECFIGGALVDAGTSDPVDPCRVCNPSQSSTGWSVATDGTSCGTGMFCALGTCASRCFIGATLYDPLQINPMNPCQQCVPATSSTAWTPIADGTACSACNTCAAGACAPTGLLDVSAFGLALHGHGAPLPNGVALWGDVAYVTDSYTGAVLSTQLDGGQAAVVSSAFSYPSGLAVSPAGDTLYVADSFAAQVDAVDVASGALGVLASGVNPAAVAVDASRIYYALAGGPSQPGGVFAVTPDGGSRTAFGDGSALALAVDGTGVYWIDDSNFAVTRAPLDGGAAAVVAPTLGYANGIGVDATNVYWTTADGGVYQAPKNGGAPLLLNPLDSDPFPVGVASDGRSVYFTDYNEGAGAGGYLRRVPVGGGNVTTLSSIGSPNHVAVDNRCVYWTTYESESLQKMDK